MVHVPSTAAIWLFTMVDSYYQAALKLEKLGLVEFKPRHSKRGKFRGQSNGYAVIATPVGRTLLYERHPRPRRSHVGEQVRRTA